MKVWKTTGKGNKRVLLTKAKPAEMAIQRRSIPPSPPRHPTTPLSDVLRGPCYPPPPLNPSPLSTNTSSRRLIVIKTGEQRPSTSTVTLATI